MRWKLFRKAFPWSKDERKELPEVNIEGKLIRIREKRVVDIPDEYAWRVDEELSRLDATRPLTMSYDDFLKYSKEEMQFPNFRSKRLAVETIEGVHIGNVMYYDLNMRNAETELGIMIGNKSTREILTNTKYVIIDEFHELIGNERGTHLSLSLERLQELTEKKIVRIGLSATLGNVNTGLQLLSGEAYL